MKKHILILFALSLFLVDGAFASETPKGFTEMHLSEAVVEQVEQDLIHAQLTIKAEGENKEDVQDDVNKRMASFVEMLSNEKDLEVYTGQYNVSQRWNAVLKRHDGFKAEQSVHLESLDKDQVLKWTAWAQKKGFTAGQLQYTLSPERLANAQDALLVKALKQAEKRAALVAETLGKARYSIVKVMIGEQPEFSNRPVPMMRMAMMNTLEESAPMTQPTIEGRKVPVSLKVSIMIHLWDEA